MPEVKPFIAALLGPSALFLPLNRVPIPLMRHGISVKREFDSVPFAPRQSRTESQTSWSPGTGPQVPL
jgi:hypothetical protein